MNRLAAIAINTFREAIRDRVLYSILFFAVIILMASTVLREITIGDYEKMMRSVGLGAISAFGSVIAIFLGIGLVYKELERKTIYTIASKPLPRWQFIVGKYLGLMGVIAAELLLLGALYVLMMMTRQGFPEPVVFIYLGLLFLELGLICGWAILFSTFATPISAAAFTIGIFVIGHLADDILMFGQRSDSEAYRQMSEVLYWGLPNFELFNISNEAVHHLPVPWQLVGSASVYGIGYTAVVLTLASMIFARRDFK